MNTCPMTREEIIAFIKKRKVAIIASIDESGNPSVKAIFKPRKMIGNYIYYFAVNSASRHVRLFCRNPNASIYFYHRDAFCCKSVMFKGKMDVLQDLEIKKELWRPLDRICYRKGATDPRYCILKFTATEGRWYNKLRENTLIVS